MTTIRTVTFNAWVGQRPDDLHKNLQRLVRDRNEPHVVAPQEVWRWDRRFPGYRTVRAERWRGKEALSTALLVRDDVEILNEGWIDTRWYGSPGWKWGPKGQPKDVHHEARVFPWARLRFEDAEFRVIGVHRSPAGFTFNRDAYVAEDAALCSWFDGHGKVPNVALGDWNCRTWDPRRHGLRSLAKRVDGGLAVKGIDGAVTRDFEVTRLRKLHKKYGSDGHRPVAINLREKR